MHYWEYIIIPVKEHLIGVMLGKPHSVQPCSHICCGQTFLHKGMHIYTTQMVTSCLLFVSANGVVMSAVSLITVGVSLGMAE